jgi:short-subunit dehydrogenase
LDKLTASIKHEHKIDIYPMTFKEKKIFSVFESANEKVDDVDALINNVARITKRR